MTSCVAHVSSLRTIICCPLHSICFHRLHGYYETVRLLTDHRNFSALYVLQFSYLNLGIRQTSQVCIRYLVYSPRPRTPTESAVSRLTNLLMLSAATMTASTSANHIYITGLYSFTLSHCGSHTPLPTLKSNLTASTSRLCTDCLLCFIRSRFSLDYILCTELAHHNSHNIERNRATSHTKDYT